MSAQPLPRVRQLVIAAEDIAAAKELLTYVLGAQVAFCDEGLEYFGLENFLLPFGDSFLEVVSPITNPPEASAGGRHIARCGGDCGYMVIVQMPDFSKAKKHFSGHGIRIIYETDRDHFDAHVKAAHLHPHDVPGAILSLDEMQPQQAWPWAGSDWRQKVSPEDDGALLLGCTLASPHPADTAQGWERALGVQAQGTGLGMRISLGNTWIDFVGPDGYDWDFDTVPNRLVGFSLLARDAEGAESILKRARERGLTTDDNAFTALGVRFDLLPTRPDGDCP